ncbi:bifunctional metallophosphatase/5'-nucleotidase [Methylocaldum sp. BRCS4]|nr:bifunctional metallophosphatase/5'-nucleotidase [Methylocaldum sp. BRCS4]
MKLNKLACAVTLILVGGTACAGAGPATTVKIVAFNDFHGQLESPGSFGGKPAGGVDWIAGYVSKLKSENRYTTVVSAGDLIGATPLVSALFHDEPTIETMNMAGLEINAVGNHEFDEGKDELKRMQKGGCHPTDPNSCQGASVGAPTADDGSFAGADFKFLAANVVDTATGKPVFPPYVIKNYGGVRVAFIGMTLMETPTIVTPSGVSGLEFKDEADTVNALIPKLRRQRVEAIVVLIHQGGTQPVAQNATTMNQCAGNLDGTPIKPIVNQLDDAVDMVISGHTHQAYNCRIANREGREIPVTSANSIGRILTDIDLTIDRKTRDVTAVSATNILVDQTDATVTPDAGIKAVVDGYKALAQPIANRVIGAITADITRTANAAGESALGDVIADAQLKATEASGFGDAVAAFMNPGGIRADLSYASGTAGEGDGNVTYGEAFTVQPFGNSVVTMTLTGAQIEILLEQQFTGCGADNAPAAFNYPAGDSGQAFDRILQVSKGFAYQWSASGSPCDKVDPASIRINGETVDPAANYRVTVNSFLADGGDKFYVLKLGTDRLGGAQDLDALEAWFNHPDADSDPAEPGVQIAPGRQDRIVRIP